VTSDDDSTGVVLGGGFVNEVVRIGNTVHRSAGPWSPTVHALLRHLAAAGFPSPRAMGWDDSGREVLSYLPGETIGWQDWPLVMLDLTGPAMLARLLRRYHDAVRSFDPGPGAVWQNPLATNGELVRHGDFSPFNTVWRDGEVVGVIDWDFAQPGKAITDVAYLAWYTVPLSDDASAARFGFTPPVPRRERLAALADAYGGVSPGDVVDAALEAIDEERRQMLELGRRGLEPWARFVAGGNPEAFERDLAWIRSHREELTGQDCSRGSISEP
jgi:phosphotransferase family enzyme